MTNPSAKRSRGQRRTSLAPPAIQDFATRDLMVRVDPLPREAPEFGDRGDGLEIRALRVSIDDPHAVA